MRAFANSSPINVRDATRVAQQTRQKGGEAAYAGGGSDMLALMKEGIVSPDVLIHLKTIPGLDRVERTSAGVGIGGLTTLSSLSQDALVRGGYTVLAEAAGSVATPQIRNAATLAGNLCQRPWCWYFRNGFPCFKAGGKTCYSIAGENQFHAIFGGGPSFIVHPSDTAPAMVALNATFNLTSPSGKRKIGAGEFFTLPRENASKENVLLDNELLEAVELPRLAPGTRSTYYKVLDREAWTHAVVSVAAVLTMEGGACVSASIVLGGVAPIPWRVPDVEMLLRGKRITPELAAKAGEAAVAGANPLAKNKYKVTLVKQIVKRTILALSTRA